MDTIWTSAVAAVQRKVVAVMNRMSPIIEPQVSPNSDL